MSDRLAALRLFVRVARSGSFSLAGRELRLSQPSVSRIMRELERDVGVQLLTRTTRAVTLTEAGSDYLVRVEQILADLEEADHAARGSGELRGVLRVAVAPSFAIREVIPRLPEFLAPHPALRVDLAMSDTRQDLVSEGVDVALRFGVLTDSTATARKVTEARRMLLAAPAYLTRAGTPTHPSELPHHRIVIGPAAAAGAWIFRRDGKTVSLRLEGDLVTNVNEAATAAGVAGLGILWTGHWGCRQELEEGRLVRLLTDWDMGGVDVHAVFPAGRAAKPAARAFADFIAASLPPLPDLAAS